MTDAAGALEAQSHQKQQALVIRDVYKSFGGIHAVNGATFSVRDGSITALDRPERSRQDDALQPRHRLLQAGRRGDHLRGPLDLPQGPVHDRPPGHGAHVPDHEGARRDAGDGQHAPRDVEPSRRAPPHPVRPPLASRTREKDAVERANELLDTFNLRTKADDYAGTLSGGQRKLLELARALMTQPRMVLLDEPMAGINPTLGRRLLEHMERLRTEEGVTFLFVEHDMDVVMNHSDEVVVMALGKVIAQGPPAAGPRRPEGDRRLPRHGRGAGRRAREGPGASR